jgi:holliday junction DNA helicase RuvB
MAMGPKRIRDMIGQDHALKEVQTACEAARGRGRALRHTALVGPGGCGKTALARTIAELMDAPFDEVMAGAVKSKKAMTEWLLSLKPYTVAFCDEFHDVSISTREQVLYSAMSSGFIVLDTKEGTQRRNLPPFTLVAATTEGKFSPSMARRFKCIALDYYSIADLTKIIAWSAQGEVFAEGIDGLSEDVNFQIEPEAALYLAQRSLGVAGIAQQRLEDAIDQAVGEGSNVITMAHVMEAMQVARIDDMGLNIRERKILIAVAREGGRPIGLESIANRTGFRDIDEEIATLTRLDLVRLNDGQRGRVATVKAYTDALHQDIPPMVLGREGSNPPQS